MRKELVERWPSWFNVNGSTYQTRMVDGFAHGDGWFDIVWRLCQDLEPLVAEAGQPFEVLQVKEKFGGLRFYVSHPHRRTPSCNASKPPNWSLSALRGVREAGEGAGRLHSDGVRRARQP